MATIQGVAFTIVNTVTRVSILDGSYIIQYIRTFVYSDNVIISYIYFNKIEDSQSAITFHS